MDVEEIDDSAVYYVKFMRVVEYNGSKFLPLPKHRMKGSYLRGIVQQEGSDVVESADAR